MGSKIGKLGGLFTGGLRSAGKLAKRRKTAGYSTETSDKSNMKRFREFLEKRHPVDPNHPRDPLFRNHVVDRYSKLLDKKDSKIRESYHQKLHGKDEFEPAETKEQTARRLHEMRQQARIEAREQTPDKDNVAVLEHAELHGFGNRHGETFKQMVHRLEKQLGSKEAAYDHIINSSKKTNASVDNALFSGKEKKVKEWKEKQFEDLQKFFPDYFKKD